MNPTAQAYGELRTAYEHFNARLFNGSLPDCLITLQRKKGCAGYFSGRRFTRADGSDVTDEIALNPAHFHKGPVEVFQTLVHEMVHLWQEHFGKPSRRTYHNKEWAERMKAVGLQPSDTGQPGGKETGQSVSDYPIPGGPFEAACAELLTQGVGVAWVEFDGYASVASEIEGVEVVEGEGEGGEETDAAASKKKIKYSCPVCGINAWGKPALNLVCGDDSVALVVAG